MSYSSRIFIYGPVSLLLLIVVLYSVFWRVQADTLSARLDRANGGEVIPGITFAFAGKTVGGYPFRLDAVLSGVTFSHQDADGETAWRTEELALHALSYNLDRYILEVTGLQSFARPPATQGSAPRVIYATPAIARASAILNNGRLARFDLDLWEPQAKDATQGADSKRSLSADRAQLHLLARPDNTIDVAAQINNARIGAGYAAAKAELVLPLIDLRAKLTESSALDDLAAGKMSVADAAQAWRERMGQLDVSDLTLNWPDARAGLKGEVAIDQAGRASGRLKGERVQNGKMPVQFGLTLDDGGIRTAALPAPAARP
ncbi:MAG: hypothetical protein QOF03_1944 [Alphaproteobacteria bacterium]|jgi:hypothetical protein|nr:hypothetical protein [Alphaproteobacteria bacterium]